MTILLFLQYRYDTFLHVRANQTRTTIYHFAQQWPGGQHVNKASTKVTLRWPVKTSAVLSPEQKEWVLSRWATRLTLSGELLLTSQEKRSQLQNKEQVLLKLEQLLKKLMHRPKPRRATRPTKASKQKRMEHKQKQSDKKKWRREKF